MSDSPANSTTTLDHRVARLPDAEHELGRPRGERACRRSRAAGQPDRAHRPRYARHLHPRVRRPAAGALAPLPAAHARPGDRPGQADRARRPARQGTARQLQPAPGRVQRPPLPEPGPAARRPRPGGHARPDPRQREVRLAQGLPLLDLRDAVDSPGDPARPGELGTHDPPARPRRPALAQGRARRARAVGAARPRAHDRGAVPRRPACRSSRSRRCATSAPRSSASTSRSARTATPRSATCCPPTPRRRRRRPGTTSASGSCTTRSRSCPKPSGRC